MRRVGRYILNGLSILSLLLCVGACGLWVRSYWWPDTVHWDRAGRHYQITSDDGGIIFAHHPYSREWSPVTLNTRDKSDVSFSQDSWNSPAGWGGSKGALGFYWHAGDGYEPAPNILNLPPLPYGYYRAPQWVLAILLAVLPGTRLARSRRRAAAGRCPACGYDLRATPARCPECGLAPAVASHRAIE